MANISWTSSSISNYFNTSLGTSANSAFSGIYNSLSDAALIKCGAYGKLMTSYYANVKFIIPSHFVLLYAKFYDL